MPTSRGKRVGKEQFDNIKRMLNSTDKDGEPVFDVQQVAKLTGYSEATVYRVKKTNSIEKYNEYMKQRMEKFNLKKSNNMPGAFKSEKKESKGVNDTKMAFRLDADYKSLTTQMQTVIEQNKVILELLNEGVEELKANDNKIIGMLEEKKRGLFGRSK